MDARVTKTLKITTPSDLEIQMSREFDAPRHLVFDAMTKAEYVPRWLGCTENEMIVCEIDLWVGGTYRFVFRSPEGRAAFQAYRTQKQIAVAAPAKLQLLDRLLERHGRDRVLIFTYDNATVYQIARRFLVPAITHQTRTKERKLILERFHSGTYPVLVTSQVLNEGVDVPAANVGIILSGTGSVREHVQRLGRLLRRQADKQALLYEVVTRGTAEEFTSERRRQHHAYQ